MKWRLFGLMVLLLALSAVPALAQDGRNTVTFNGISFSFDSALATNVNVSQFPGDPVDLESPGGPEVPHTRFLLYNGDLTPENFFDAVGSIRVYRTADFAGYTIPTERLQQLQDLLAQRPDLAAYMVVDEGMWDRRLPFMPVFPAAQVMRARARYVDTAAMAGVSFVTAYRQDASPFINNEFLYTFQGLSADGTYYVSAIFRLTTDLFPSELPADFDYEAFAASIMDYFTDSAALLNEASPEAFSPSLTTLDAVIQSFAFGG